jgi:phage terminase large subunit-like protein
LLSIEQANYFMSKKINLYKKKEKKWLNFNMISEY